MNTELPLRGIPIKLQERFRKIFAQDPAPDAPATDPAAAADPAADLATDAPKDEPPEGPDSEEMVKEVEESPAAEWQQYDQPIIAQLQQYYGLDVAQLSQKQRVPLSDDPALGFHLGFKIIGVIELKDGVPANIADKLAGQPLRFEATITPGTKDEAGQLADVALVLPDDPSISTEFRSLPNRYRSR